MVRSAHPSDALGHGQRSVVGMVASSVDSRDERRSQLRPQRSGQLSSDRSPIRFGRGQFTGGVGIDRGKSATRGEWVVMAAPKLIKPVARKAKPLPGATGGARKAVASNRRARHDYEIVDTYEAGIVLRGSEVKSLRAAQVQMKDAYARVERGEILLLGVHIAPYGFAHGFGAHVPDSSRKLLLHKREITEIAQASAQGRLAIIPLSIYFENGLAKVELALGRGLKQHDKRDVMADRDAQRDIDRALAANRRAVAARRRS